MSSQSSAVESFTRFVLVLFVALALGLMFLTLAAKHTHPKPTHPGNQRPATTRPHPAHTGATP